MNGVNLVIQKYVNDKVILLRESGIYVSDKAKDDLIMKYSYINMNMREIMKEIDDRINEYVETYKRIKELREAYMRKMEEHKELTDLPLEYSGITLNKQDIDLMRIEDSETPLELQDTLEDVSNRRMNLDDIAKVSDEDFVRSKKEAFRLYQETLVDKNEAIKNPNINIQKKIKYLKDSGELSKEEQDSLDKVLETSSSKRQIIEGLNNEFGEEKAHRMYEIIHECSPVEKTGIKHTSYNSIHNLNDKVKNDFNSITIDQEAKYGSVILPDGTFNFDNLDAILEYCKKMGIEVRLNALIFYMDCPDELYNLDVNDENKGIVKEKLISYVDSLTKHIKDNGYEDTVRSIDVFNELLNRYPEDGSYKYRGDIEQVCDSNGIVLDNIKSGWLKHLDINDLCDVIAVARGNLPKTDFMYNDDNLEDSNKLAATYELIKKIKDYESSHGIKIVDSIGTQMHVDNNVSKNEIETMLRGLKELEYPIEITEFDMAMTHNINGLSDKEIKETRQKKINEIYEVFDSLKDECNIRGLTIWSKTDSQNFRVSLENEKRINKGEEPIDTLHGGYYTEMMEDKSKQLVKDEPYQEYNYHTHTNRCGHAGEASDSEYIEVAKKSGIKTIGFSDHIPYTEIEYPDKGHRMNIDEVDNYLLSIDKLRGENPDIKILSGFEAEYDPAKIEFLCDIRDKVDYMILGQHFVKDGINKVDRDNNVDYPLEYAKSVCNAMETGLFDIVAHPDIFFEYIKTIESEEDKEIFIENSIAASKMICETALEMDIPLELNLSGASRDKEYPNAIFWKIASETGVKVVSGADAHDPSQLETMPVAEEKAENKINNVELNKVDIDYNPKEEREKNSKLQEAMDITRTIGTSYDVYLITQLVNKLMSNNDKEDIKERGFDTSQSIREMALKENPSKMIEKINNDERLNALEKKKKLDRLKKEISTPEYQKVYEKRQKLLKNAATYVENAVDNGCKSNGEVISFVRKSMVQNKDKEVVKNNTISNTIPVKEKPKTLVKTNNDNKGYALSIAIPSTFIITFTIIISLLILYYIFR